MGTMTAQIIIGRTHIYHDGIHPTHTLYLSENSRPAWILTEQNLFPENQEESHRSIWIPTVKHMLEDAFLMTAVHVLKDPEIIAMIQGFTTGDLSNRFELYSNLTEDQRSALYEKCKEISRYPKMIISVFEDSTIMEQFRVVQQYQMDVEVCIPVFSRLHSIFESGIRIKGELHTEDG